MKRLFFILWFVALFILSACGGGGGDSGVDDKDSDSVIKDFSGKIEKGALQKGATISASEWSPATGYSGKVFNTETLDNLGGYTIESSELQGLLDIRADGFFMNENTNTVESTRIILSGLADSAEEGGNINIITHIIKQRVINLIKNESKTFAQANTQAVSELYATLNWTPENPLNTSISQNAKLLFLSAAICKNRTVDQVSALLTTLTADMADGVVDISVLDESFGLVDTAVVTANIQAMYGACPDIVSVKSAILDYRNIVDPIVRVFTVSPVAYSGVDWYIGCAAIPAGWTSPAPTIREFPDGLGVRILWMKDGKYDSTNHFQVSMTYLGETTNDVANNILEFFSNELDGSAKILYFSLGFESDTIVKNYKQENGIVTEIEVLPSKPGQVLQSLNDGFYTYSNPVLSDGVNNWNVGAMYGYRICDDYIEGTYHRGKTIFVEHGVNGIMMCGSDYTYTADGGYMYGTWNARFW